MIAWSPAWMALRWRKHSPAKCAASADLIVVWGSDRSVWEPAGHDIGDVAALERRFPVWAE
jgi:hypothetical protein